MTSHPTPDSSADDPDTAADGTVTGSTETATAQVCWSGTVATIALTAVNSRLPLSMEGIAELSAALDHVLDGPVSPRVLVLTGTGKVFATGADLAAIAKNDAAANAAYNRMLIDTFERIASADMPVIAAINGLALGGGLELALTADIRIASEKARLGLPEVGLGLIPGAGGTQRLPRLIGEPHALDLLLTGRVIDAAEAQRISLVSRVVPSDELAAAASELADQLAAQAPLAQTVIKQQVHTGRTQAPAAAIDHTHAAITPLLNSHDLAEGIAAFLAKRMPAYLGR